MIVEFIGDYGWRKGDLHNFHTNFYSGNVKYPIGREVLEYCRKNGREIDFYRYEVKELQRKFRKAAGERN